MTLSSPGGCVLLVSMKATARKELVADPVVEVVATLGEGLRGRFTTIEADRTRQRDLPRVADRL